MKTEAKTQSEDIGVPGVGPGLGFSVGLLLGLDVGSAVGSDANMIWREERENVSLGWR